MALTLITYVGNSQRATAGRKVQNRKSRKPFNDFLLGGAAGGGWYSVLNYNINIKLISGKAFL